MLPPHDDACVNSLFKHRPIADYRP